MEYVGILFVIMGGWVFLSWYKHMLVMLLSLEIMMLGLYIMLGCWKLMFLGEEMVLMIFLGFSVCEGSVGLSLMVMFVRMYGSDYFNNFSILWC
uniref:NADH-ubiquinone oxidoreductase chain 4L n=1 Tax=Scolopocryptops sp. 1 YG-2013 TaxID=1285684 RepID=R4IVU0_9MYRI|nr:NAHD dehydrogenase subunit 4L [Scolopocryptops sp. 1 YG-2013]